MLFMCLEMVWRRRRLYDLVIDPAANVDVTKGEPTYMRRCGIEDKSILAATRDSSFPRHPRATRRATLAPRGEMIELRFPTLLASLRQGDIRSFHANMVFIEGLFDDSIYHTGMDSAKWKFSVFNKA